MSLYDLVSQECYNTVQTFFHPNITVNFSPLQWSGLDSCLREIGISNAYKRYAAPMPLIGIYMAFSSLLCIIFILLDLKHGLLSRQFWFPCKHFTPNEFTLILIGNAVKVSTDMTSPMPGFLDQVAKLGSSSQLFVILANFFPSYASVVNKNPVSNILGLSYFIIVVVTNICIEINTNLIHNLKKYRYHADPSLPKGNPLINDGAVVINFSTLQTIQVGFLIYFLFILISTTISIPTIKEILECKYQGKRKKIANEQYIGTWSLYKPKKDLQRYWIMAKSSSPQFVMVSSPFSYACGILCLYILVSHIFLVLKVCRLHLYLDYESDYKWSMLLKFTMDSVIVVLGSISPICRSFMALRYKSFSRYCRVVFKVEKYWTQMLCGWKENCLPIPSGASRLRIHSLFLQNILLSVCIVLQNIVLVSCNMLGLIGIVPIIFVRFCLNHWKSLKALLFTTSLALSTDDTNEDNRNYVLYIEDRMELPEVIVKDVSYSMSCLIKKVDDEKKNNLLRLLGRSTSFEGIKLFDIDQVQPLLPVELVNSWSLPIVTITCIVFAIPNIENNIVDRFIKAISDGFSLIGLVEESFSHESDYLNVRMASMNAWKNFKYNHKWLGKTLEKDTFNGKTSAEILKWFVDTARDIVLEIKTNINDDLAAGFSQKLIIANSMYRIAETLLVLNYDNNSQHPRDTQLFELLSRIISDIMCACFTNIPRAIQTRCYESVVEKREANVEAATVLLGRGGEILRKIDAHELPSIDPKRKIFIDEWRLHMQRSIP